jgi:ribonuclease P protein component
VRSAGVRRVFREGESFHGRRVVLFLAPGCGEAAFVAARRIGGAVERNRARRILRPAWKAVSAQAGTEGFDAVLVAREAIKGARTHDLVSEMSELLREHRDGR